MYLSITADYARSWTSREAIREFVQNWIDGMKENLKKEEHKYFSIGKMKNSTKEIFKIESYLEPLSFSGTCKEEPLGT